MHNKAINKHTKKEVNNMFGKKLKELRLKNELTQQKLAEELNTVQTTYSGWEKDKREPSYEKLKTIANYFNVSIDYLLDNDNYDNNSIICKLERTLNKEQKKKLEEMCKIMFPNEYKEIKKEQL